MEKAHHTLMDGDDDDDDDDDDALRYNFLVGLSHSLFFFKIKFYSIKMWKKPQ